MTFTLVASTLINIQRIEFNPTSLDSQLHSELSAIKLNQSPVDSELPQYSTGSLTALTWDVWWEDKITKKCPGPSWRDKTCFPIPTYLPTYLSNYLPTHPPTYLHTYLPIHLPTYQPICLKLLTGHQTESLLVFLVGLEKVVALQKTQTQWWAGGTNCPPFEETHAWGSQSLTWHVSCTESTLNQCTWQCHTDQNDDLQPVPA